MRNTEFASHVHDVFAHGLDLVERLDIAKRTGREKELDFEAEHGRILALFWPEGEVAENPDFKGTPSGFLGARYALACWLDELFIPRTPTSDWDKAWAEASMEYRVFGTTQQRAWRFWQQAKLAAAQTRAGTDALEVYLWCFALGFKGEPDPEVVKDPHAWANTTRGNLIMSRNQPFPHETGLPLRRPIRVLTGRQAFNRMTTFVTLAAAAAGLALMYYQLKPN